MSCPACLAGLRSEEALLARLAAGPMDTDWMSWCHLHTWRLHAYPGLARDYARVRLRTELARLDRPSPPRRQDPSASGATTGPGGCPCCTAASAAAASTLNTQGGAIALCVPHLTLVWEGRHGREVARRATVATLEHYRAIEADLTEAIEKADYRFIEVERGPEATAWLRALRLLAGAPGVRWALRVDRELEG